MSTATDAIKLISELTRQELDAVQSAVTARSKYLREQEALTNQATLTPGTRVMTKGLRPKYLNGLHGEVIATPTRRSKDIAVKIDADDRYFVTGRYNLDALAVPANCLIEA